MGGGEPQADRTGLCKAPVVFSGKPLRFPSLIGEVADDPGFEALLRRQLGMNCLKQDDVVARNRSGMQQNSCDRYPANPTPKTHTNPTMRKLPLPVPRTGNSEERFVTFSKFAFLACYTASKRA